MPDPYLVKPDRDFLHRVIGQSGGDLKKCMQCATCSVVCELSNGRKLFPRKEMIWAQWGLKDRLLADADVWLCHQCNDCSTRCPRGARPGDVLAAVRRQGVEHYAVPRKLGAWCDRSGSLPLVLLVPIVLLGLALLLRRPIESIGPLQGLLGFLGHQGFYADFFPHWLLIGFFSFFTGLTALAALVGLVRFWGAMKAADEASGQYTPVLGVVPSLVRTLKSILAHEKFGKCTDRASRRLSHLLAFYGFAALFVVTVWAVLDLYVLPQIGVQDEPFYPFVLMHPMKILANVGCLVLIFGCIKAIADRVGSRGQSAVSTSFDWVFLGLLLAVSVSGLLTEVLRFLADPGGHDVLRYTAYTVYFVHLVLVFDLLVYLPYSKFAHVVYRTAALVYAEHCGRSRRETEGREPLAASQ